MKIRDEYDEIDKELSNFQETFEQNVNERRDALYEALDGYRQEYARKNNKPTDYSKDKITKKQLIEFQELMRKEAIHSTLMLGGTIIFGVSIIITIFLLAF